MWTVYEMATAGRGGSKNSVPTAVCFATYPSLSYPSFSTGYCPKTDEFVQVAAAAVAYAAPAPVVEHVCTATATHVVEYITPAYAAQ